MKLKTNKQFIPVYNSRKTTKTAAEGFTTPLNKNQSNNLRFKGDAVAGFGRYVDKINKRILYTNSDKLISNIDQTIGNDKFFTKALIKAEILKPDASGNIVVPKKLDLDIIGAGSDIYYALTFPIFEMPVRIANAVIKKFGGTPIETKRLHKVELAKNYKLCQDILDIYFREADAKKVNKYFKLIGKANNDLVVEALAKRDFDKSAQQFKDTVGKNINKLFKGYNSRDERTLNRAATSIVSALYSANDFYNISMLQKDDKKEAKKAHNARFKQEITRMMLSAGMTFLTLGALDKVVKRSLLTNAIVIAMSSLISEVGSRLFNGTPLLPLTPEQAKKIAQQRKAKNSNNAQNTVNQNNPLNEKTVNSLNSSNVANTQFKGINKKHHSTFVQFASKDGTFTPINSLMQSTAKEATAKKKDEPKKKISLSKILGTAFFVSSLAYITSAILKGKFSAKMARRELYKQPGVKDKIIETFISGDKVPDEVINTLNKINSAAKQREKFFSFEEKFKDKFLKYKTSFDVGTLKEKVLELKKLKEADEISPILDEFLVNIEKLEAAANNQNAKLPSGLKKIDGRLILEYSKDLPAISGFYNGFTKVFKTVYKILSIPGLAVESLLNKTIFGESEAAFDALSAKNYKFGLNDIKKELIGLNDLTSKKSWSSQKILNYIKRNTRSFETSAETGELANLSRTMVTAISTFFFVNDYTNKVLIESEGRDVETAKEERKERLAHKISNFIINGTLMNVFNSVFKFPLNSSLLGATVIATATETTNEFFVRKSICQPFHKMKSRQDIIEYENEQMNKKGFMGWWSRTFKKLTGKKSLTQKVGVSSNDVKKDK